MKAAHLLSFNSSFKLLNEILDFERKYLNIDCPYKEMNPSIKYEIKKSQIFTNKLLLIKENSVIWQGHPTFAAKYAIYVIS